MLDKVLAKVVGTQNERELKRLRPVVALVGDLEPAMQALTDEQIVRIFQPTAPLTIPRLGSFRKRLRDLIGERGL